MVVVVVVVVVAVLLCSVCDGIICVYIYIYIISVASRVLSREARVHAILNIVRSFPCFPPAVSVRKEARCSPFFASTYLFAVYIFNINSAESFGLSFFCLFSRDVHSSREGESFCFIVKRRKRVNRIKIKSYLMWSYWKYTIQWY